MSPFVLPDEPVTLTFEGSPYAGAEVTVRLSPVSVLAFKEYIELAATKGVLSEEALAVFADIALIEWNLADAAGPLPLTADGLRRADRTLMAVVCDEWTKRIMGIARPLVVGSNDTDASATTPAKTPPSST